VSIETLSRVVCSATLEPAADGTLPTEFRIFKAGINETSKGPFLFDEQAARDVMAHYQREGVDLIVDLEHLSLDHEAPHYDPDARGHFKLAVRDGELWACSVAWAPDGRRRLGEKTQRYISPVAMRDRETKRVVSIANVALVAQPATYHAPALVAASKTPRVAHTQLACNALIALNRSGKNMSPELLKKILAAIEAGEDKSGLLAEIVAAQAGGGEPAPAPSEPLAATADPPPEKPAELSALAKALGCSSEADAVAEVVALRRQVAAQKAATDAVELETRRDMISELVKLGAEFPALCWEGDAAARNPAPHLAAEPLNKLRERVALHKAQAAKRGPITPPTSTVGEIEWTPSELVALSKMTPEQQTNYKALRASRRAK
jgi:phage I-like protein